jgi:hypothetical protein
VLRSLSRVQGIRELCIGEEVSWAYRRVRGSSEEGNGGKVERPPKPVESAWPLR